MPEDNDPPDVVPLLGEGIRLPVSDQDAGVVPLNAEVLDHTTAGRRKALLSAAPLATADRLGESDPIHPLIQHWLGTSRADVHDFEAVSRDIATLFEAFQYGMLDDLLQSTVMRTRSERGLFFRDVFHGDVPLKSNQGECRTLATAARAAIVQKYPELRKNILVVHGWEPRYFNKPPAKHVYLMMVDGTIKFDGQTFDGGELPGNFDDPELDVEVEGEFWLLDPSFGFAGRPDDFRFQGRSYSILGVLPPDYSMRHLVLANDDRDAGDRLAVRVGSVPLARLRDGRVIFLGVRGTIIRSLSDIGIAFQDPGRDYAEAISLDHWEVEARLKNDSTVLAKVIWLRNKLAHLIS